MPSLVKGRRMSRGTAALLATLAASACGGQSDGASTDSARDTAFAAMQERGEHAMGVDQYSSAHVFEPLPDGGRIVLQRDRDDSAGTETIRAHMRTIATAFARGNFAVPGFVHAQSVPGTSIMRERRAFITYEADTLPRGGEVRIRTRDSAAIDAVHAFLAFQRREHHAPAHAPGQSPSP